MTTDSSHPIHMPLFKETLQLFPIKKWILPIHLLNLAWLRIPLTD